MRQGFTLLELSIVLIIIGLIAGAIAAGNSVIHASELRSLSSDIDRYSSAVNTFKLKYQGLPGDLATATSYWGSAGGTGSDSACFSTVGTGTATCNGNGDGLIANDPTGTHYEEVFLLWRHLADAGLVAGNFSGVAGPGGAYNAVVGVNIPPTRISNGGISLFFIGQKTSGNWYNDYYGHAMIVGATDSAYENFQPIMTGTDAYSIDAKFDDGKPGTGTVRTYNSNSLSCATTTDPTTAIYNITGSAIICSLIFLTNI